MCVCVCVCVCMCVCVCVCVCVNKKLKLFMYDTIRGHAYDLHHVCCLKANKNVSMNKWIARFVTETRHKDGSTYPP